MSSTKSAQTGHGHGLVGAAKALSGSTVCTENLNASVVVMKSAQDGA